MKIIGTTTLLLCLAIAVAVARLLRIDSPRLYRTVDAVLASQSVRWLWSR